LPNQQQNHILYSVFVVKHRCWGCHLVLCMHIDHAACDMMLPFMCFAGHSTIQTPWHLSVQCNQYEAITQSWCWQPSIQQNTVTGSATETWQSLASGAETKIGYVVECQRSSITSDDFTPDTVLVNGMPCFVIKE